MSIPAHRLIYIGDITACNQYLGLARNLLAHAAKTRQRVLKRRIAEAEMIRVEHHAGGLSLIYIEAGGKSPMMAHGYLGAVANSEFVIYDGKRPKKFTDPIPLTGINTLAKAPPEAVNFNRYNQLGDDDYILFGGPADLVEARAPSVKNEGGGRILYRGVEYDTGGGSVYDARAKAGVIHALYRSGVTDGRLVYATVPIGAKTLTDKWYVDLSGDTNDVNSPLSLYGTKLFIKDRQAASSALLASMAGPTAPAGATEEDPLSEMHFQDARFDLDCATVSILAIFQRYYTLAADVHDLGGNPLKWKDGKDPGGGVERVSVIDLTLRVGGDYPMAPPSGAADGPITSTIYANQGYELRAKINYDVTDHSDFIEGPITYFDWVYAKQGNNMPPLTDPFPLGLYIPGEDDPAAYENYYETEEQIESKYFGKIAAMQDPLFNWAGGVTYEWNPEGTEGDIYSERGVATRKSGPFSKWGFPVIGGIVSNTEVLMEFPGETFAVTVTRVAKKYYRLAMNTVIEVEASGGYFCGYSFDTDKGSPTYKQRRWVEVGYRPGGGFNTPLRFLYTTDIALYPSFPRSSEAYPGSRGEMVQYVTNGSPPHYTNTAEVGIGGAIALGVYVGDQLIGRVGAIQSFTTGVKRTVEVHWDLTSVSRRVYTDPDGGVAVDLAGDSLTARAGATVTTGGEPSAEGYPPQRWSHYTWIDSVNDAPNLIPGQFNYDLGTSAYSLNVTTTKAYTQAEYDTSVYLVADRETTIKVATFAGQEHPYDIGSAEATDWEPVNATMPPALSLSSLPTSFDPSGPASQPGYQMLLIPGSDVLPRKAAIIAGGEMVHYTAPIFAGGFYRYYSRGLGRGGHAGGVIRTEGLQGGAKVVEYLCANSIVNAQPGWPTSWSNVVVMGAAGGILRVQTQFPAGSSSSGSVTLGVTGFKP